MDLLAGIKKGKGRPPTDLNCIAHQNYLPNMSASTGTTTSLALANSGITQTEHALALIQSLERLVETYHRAYTTLGMLFTNMELLRKQQADASTHRAAIIVQLERKTQEQDQHIELLKSKISELEMELQYHADYLEEVEEAVRTSLPSTNTSPSVYIAGPPPSPYR